MIAERTGTIAMTATIEDEGLGRPTQAAGEMMITEEQREGASAHESGQVTMTIETSASG
jgi:hypothetical protein